MQGDGKNAFLSYSHSPSLESWAIDLFCTVKSNTGSFAAITLSKTLLKPPRCAVGISHFEAEGFDSQTPMLEAKGYLCSNARAENK